MTFLYERKKSNNTDINSSPLIISGTPMTSLKSMSMKLQTSEKTRCCNNMFKYDNVALSPMLKIYKFIFCG